MNAALTIDSIFCEAIEIELDERQAYLAQVCADDADLRKKVERLLQAHERNGSILENPRHVLRQTLDQGVGIVPGTRIGPYLLREQIGEGGMGLVFVADQEQPVRRRVALKVVKPGMDTRQVLARFEAERQALALMDHPNIAKVLDGGTIGAVVSSQLSVVSKDPTQPPLSKGRSQNGRPYFVMELVRGVPITDYCDSARLTTRQRLELFLPICRAIQHAHQKGIIHRDLKPSNLLVTLYDSHPVPKVIDFGIAKAVGPGFANHSVYTGFAQLIGTPMYMSPEQAEMSAQDVDTRADVYALGVVLYELLTGTTPFDGETLRQAEFDEMRRIIREDEPARPSHRVTTLSAEKQTTVTGQRGVDGRQLGRQLRGGLDWVVMTCLAKDRTRRYESAGALASDVERYLRHEAVEACPPSTSYRVRTFARRHRRMLATVGVIAVALVTATAVSMWQAVKARESERRASNEASVATAIGEFLQQDLLLQAETYVQRDDILPPKRNLTVKEALDRAAEKIGPRFHGKPLVEAAIRHTVGQAYQSVGEYEPAISHLERAVALYKANVGPRHPDTFNSIRSLGVANRYLSRHGHSITLYQEILDSRSAVSGPDHPETLESIHQLAVAYEYAGQLDVSVRLLEQLVEKSRNLFGPTHSRTLSNMSRLAWNYALTDHLTESLSLMRWVREFRKSMANPQQSLQSWWHILACQWIGELDEAELLLCEQIEFLRGQPASPIRQRELASNLATLALNLVLQGRHAEAELFAREAVAINHPEEHKRSYAVSVLGAALLGQRKYDEAEPFLLQGWHGLTQTAGIHPGAKRRHSQAGEWVIRLYEEKGQHVKASSWREKLSQNKRKGE